jgi:hypothetical protein
VLTDVICVIARTSWFRRGPAGWVLLAAGVLAWDLAAADGQTLSESFRRGQDIPAARFAAAVAWLVLTAHLFGLIPQRADPLHAVYVIRDALRASCLR